jgi:hypothetical protein
VIHKIVSFEQAQKLKSKGFKLESNYYYSSSGDLKTGSHVNNMMQRFLYAAPSYSMVLSWLKSEFDIWTLHSDHLRNKPYIKGTPYDLIYTTTLDKDFKKYIFEGYDSLEESSSAAIDFAIENLI